MDVLFYPLECSLLPSEMSYFEHPCIVLLRYPEDNNYILDQQLTLEFHNSSGDMMKQSKGKMIQEDTPEAMLKRVFAIAQIIFQSDSYKNNIQKPQQSRQKTQNR